MRDALLCLLSRWCAAVRRRPHLLVLALHRVSDLGEFDVHYLRRHLEFMAQHYDTVTPSRLCEGRTGRRMAMVTIDDCHEDTYQTVFPMAQPLGIPLTVCVPTDFFFRGRWLWFDKLSWGLRQAAPGIEVQVGTRRLVVGSEASEKAFSNHLKRIGAGERAEVIEQTLSELSVVAPDAPVSSYRPVSGSEMREMLVTGMVELCSHTVTHPIVTRLTDDELRRELVESKRELEAYGGQEVVSFCYPNGAIGDFDERTRSAVRNAGYRVAFTLVEGLNWVNRMDCLELKRVHAHTRFSVFLKLASGLGEVQQRLKRLFSFGTSAGRTARQESVTPLDKAPAQSSRSI